MAKKNNILGERRHGRLEKTLLRAIGFAFGFSRAIPGEALICGPGLKKMHKSACKSFAVTLQSEVMGN